MKELGVLRDLRSDLGAKVFLVGGTVRDLVRRKEPKDLDFLVRDVSPSEFEGYLRERGKLQLVGKSFGVYNFIAEGFKQPIEIAFPRTEVSTGPEHDRFEVTSDPSISIQEDSNRRDFTINAMYLAIEDIDTQGKFDRKAIIDFHHGLDHIRRRLIVGVGDPELRIGEDPLRMLRSMVLISRTGYRLEGNTFGAIKRQAPALATVSNERIRDEVIKIMSSPKPSRAFKAMARTGLLEHAIPELSEAVGCGQNPKYHSYPVFEHLIYAVDAACSITSDLKVRFGALCHDFGKARTREVRPGGSGPDDVSFHNHEIVSTKMTYTFMKRLRFPNQFIEDVVHLVRWHQYKYDRDWTDKAVRRFIRNTGITKSDLDNLDQHPQFLLRQADRMGNQLKAHLPITQKQRDFQDRIREVYHKSSAHSLRDLKVTGTDIMAGCDLPAGPLIGRITRHLFETVEENPALNTKERLLEISRQYIADTKKGEETHGNHRVNE